MPTMRSAEVAVWLRSLASALVLLACKGNLDLGHNGRAIAPVDSAVLVAQQAPATTVRLRLSGYTDQDGVSLSCTHDAGPGVTVECAMDGGSATSGTLTLRADQNSRPGDHCVLVAASPSPSTGSLAPAVTQAVAFTVAVGVTVSPEIDTTSGQGGRLDEFMATAFQPADWQSDFFLLHPDTSPLQALAPRHILVQVMNGGAIPLKQDSQGTLYWDFTELDSIVQSVLDVSALNPVPDSGPELQIAVAPSVTGMTDATGIVVSTAFAAYCASLVGYYNKGHFKDPFSKDPNSAQTITNPRGATPIRWWGIWSDYNVGTSQLMPGQYSQLYNATVPAMLAVDGQIAFSALEFDDFSGAGGDPSPEVQAFVAGFDASAPVQAASLHFYGTDDLTASDKDVFAAIPSLAKDIGAVYGKLQAQPALAGVPVWITQNNVNGDAPNSTGNSTFKRTRPFQDDPRGTSAFFAAWRPYLFSEAGKAGNRGLFHWEYTAGHCGTPTAFCADAGASSDTDSQNAEIDYLSGRKYLSYWVDYELGHMFPSPPGEDILQSAVSDSQDVEVLAAQQDNGSVVVMVVNKAVADATPDAGTGMALTVVVDVSALKPAGGFGSASTIMLDAATPRDTGPVAESVVLGDGRVPVVFSRGYGTAFVVLNPAP
jgi:hypothetical protein